MNLTASNIKNKLSSYIISDKADLFRHAQQIRDSYWGNKIFIYGFLYLSTYCRNNCSFCQYRSSNKTENRYRKSLSELLEAGKRLADDGVHLLDLTLGEDPYYIVEENFSRLEEIVSELKYKIGLPIMVSPGVLTKEQLKRLHDAGASWYACYQETHNMTLFNSLRLEQDFFIRKQARLNAREVGLLVEDGLLVGVGETEDMIISSLAEMYNEPLSQVRAMSYVPHESTIVSPAESTNKKHLQELLTIAMMRIIMPQRLIPASLDVDGLEGLKIRLEAGANVVTSVIPSGRGFAGVASKDLDIENENRSVKAVSKQAESLGLQIASQVDYENWMKEQLASRI